jgi:hypothetical protein
MSDTTAAMIERDFERQCALALERFCASGTSRRGAWMLLKGLIAAGASNEVLLAHFDQEFLGLPDSLRRQVGELLAAACNHVRREIRAVAH